MRKPKSARSLVRLDEMEPALEVLTDVEADDAFSLETANHYAGGKADFVCECPDG